MPGGTLTDDGETTPMKKPVEELTEKPAAKPATKTELNKVIPATPRTIDPTRGFWSKVAQGGNFNKSEFAEVGSKGKPIKQTIQSNETTKVPGPQHTTEDGSFRTCAAFGWTLRDSSDQEIDAGSGSLGPFCTAFDGEVAAIENGISALLRCRQPFKHVTVHSDSTAAIARVQHNKRGPGQSRAVKVISHVQR
jgi:hypothetical protein